MVKGLIFKVLLGFVGLTVLGASSFAAVSEPPPLITEGPWNGKIYDTKTRQIIALEQLAERFKESDIIVLGEKHYSSPTQNAEGLLIELGVKSHSSKELSFSTAWEFLNHSKQAEIDQHYGHYLNREINTEMLLAKIHGGKYANLYGPLFEVTREYRGHILGVNLSREEKAPIIEKGLEGIDPALVPPGFELGGDSYFLRFQRLMEGHGTPDKIKNYFIAQCLTDDVMASTMANNTTASLQFLVTGAFHMEYNDGMISRLRVRMPDSRLTTVRILDVNDYLESELQDLIHDPEFGALADFIYFVREPYNP